jgi:hypothetical protein
MSIGVQKLWSPYCQLKNVHISFKIFPFWALTTYKSSLKTRLQEQGNLSCHVARHHATQQGCQMFFFQTETSNFDFLRALDWKTLIYFMAIWNIVWTFVIFYDHSVHCVFIWYIFPVFVSCAQENLATLPNS